MSDPQLTVDETYYLTINGNGTEIAISEITTSIGGMGNMGDMQNNMQRPGQLQENNRQNRRPF